MIRRSVALEGLRGLRFTMTPRIIQRPCLGWDFQGKNKKNLARADPLHIPPPPSL